MIGMSGYYCLRPPRVDALNAKETEVHTEFGLRSAECCHRERDAPPVVLCRIILSVGALSTEGR
jgi:hypothetical protein